MTKDLFPGVRLNISDDDRRRAGWPTPEKSGLQHFFTVAFDAEIIRQTITMQPSGVLDLGVWIDGVVPECYREQVRALVLEVFDRFRSLKYTDDLRERFIVELRREIWGRVDPIAP